MRLPMQTDSVNVYYMVITSFWILESNATLRGIMADTPDPEVTSIDFERLRSHKISG
jgi:hypothetical protein